MITQVRSVMLYVEDQARAVDFYTNKLGFELRTDGEMWPGARWVEVAPPGAQTPIVLAAAADFDAEVGQAAFTLTATDVRTLYRELKEKGVTVTEPVTEPWSTFMKITDPDGHVVLVADG